MLIPILLASFALYRPVDAWTIRPSFDVKAPKQAWAIDIEAQSQGQNHHAVFQFTRLVKSAADAKTVVTYGWEHLTIDDEQGQEIPAWDAVAGSQGQILKMDGDAEDSIRRMLSPMVFAYPDKPVAVGDKWSVVITPPDKGQTFTYNCEAAAIKDVDGTPTLLVAVKVKEDGPDAITGSGTWWVSKEGKVLKFELKLKTWVVPMAGTDDITDVVMTGSAKVS